MAETLGKKIDASRALEFRCLDGPLKGVMLSGRSDDHRPIWYAPVTEANLKYRLYRCGRFENLPEDLQAMVQGCYVESQACSTDLWYFAWSKGNVKK